jgi:GntR family transcriptional regulator, transcriptional repressor for pyruvate dehydrogenase complex
VTPAFWKARGPEIAAAEDVRAAGSSSTDLPDFVNDLVEMLEIVGTTSTIGGSCRELPAETERAREARVLQSEPIRIPKAAVVVAGHIRRSIVYQQLSPNDALPNETELMAVYQVSRSVVREALRILESESLIEVKRGVGGGARVRKPDIGVAARPVALLLQTEGTTLEDVFEARSLLEPAAVRRLATLRPPEAIERLKERHAEELAAVDDPVAFPVAATLFHEELIELAGNKTLRILGRLLLEIVEAHHRMTFAALDGEASDVACQAVHTWHGPLIDMIDAGDVEGAARHWELHLKMAADVALERLGPTTVVDLLNRPL